MPVVRPSPCRSGRIVQPSSHRRRGSGARVSLILAFALASLHAVSADQILAFTTSTGSVAGVTTAEIKADGRVVMRLRAGGGSPDALLRKADVIASRLTELALGGLTPGQLAVQKVGGDWALTGAGQLIATGDADTAAASGLPPQNLCESWLARLAETLGEPYLTLQPADSILVPSGETRTVRFGGTAKTAPTAQSTGAEIASAQVDAEHKRITLRGLATGTTAVKLTLGDSSLSLEVVVKRWAAHLVDHATARVIGAGLRGPMADAAARNAVLAAISVEAGANVRLTSRDAAASGMTISVRADGRDLIPISGDVKVRFTGNLAPIPLAQTLLVSNCPEKVTGVGALMRQQLTPGSPARLMWHHKNYADRPLALVVRLMNAGGRPARLRLDWAGAGPDSDEVYVGFNAMARYWEGTARGQGFEAVVPAGRVFEALTTPMAPADVVSGIMDISADDGDELYVEVAGRELADAPAGFTRVLNTGEPLAVTAYEFPATLDHELSYQLGGPFAHLSIGRDEVVNDQGVALAGAYGVLHRIRAAISNPTVTPGRVEIALRAGGGVARAVAIVDGTTTNTTLLRAAEEDVIARYDLQPGASRSVAIELMPTAGSNLPLTLVVRGYARPPLPAVPQ